MKIKITLIVITLLLINFRIYSKQYKGAEYRTKASYLYGRFEVRMKPAHRSGVVSSFFTYHEITDISEWNEIDIENIGRYDDEIQFNAITPNQTNHVRNQVTNFNPYEDFHIYAFEWTPFYVAWFIDGTEVYRQTDSHVGTLNKAQKIMMNLWNSQFVNWVGEWSDASLPAFSYYDWVKYYAYTPGSGNYGTDNNFTLDWSDDFNFFDTNRWQKATHTFYGNLCDFTPENAQFIDGNLVLCLTDENNLGYQDNAPPQVEYASAYSNGKIKVKFSEELEKASAENISNYFLTSGSVTLAEISADKISVLLTTTGYDPTQSANIIVQNVKDLAGNAIAASAKSVLPLNYLTLPAKINVGGTAVLGYLSDEDWDITQEYGHISGANKDWPAGINIEGTDDDVIYLHDRENFTKYLIRVPNGNYKVTFMFAEKSWNSANKRVFDVYLENQLKIANLDLFDSVGTNYALNISVNVAVEDELLDIVFSPERDITTLSGIKIEENPNSVEGFGKVENFKLFQNYPNPFSKGLSGNSTTTINYVVPKYVEKNHDFSLQHVTLTVFDALGRKVATLVNKQQSGGNYSVRFNANKLTSGVYFYSLHAGNFISTRKMILMK